MAGFHIRDGIESDIAVCLELDHNFETDHVWQMNITNDNDNWQISFRKERLPRAVQVEHPVNERRLRLSLPEDQCFLVTADRNEPDIIAYLSMRYDPVWQTAWLQDIVVDADLRRQKLGTRLFKIARRWAQEHEAKRIMVETRTKNYPMIKFCTQNGLNFCGYNDNYLENQDIAVFFVDELR